jgi:hypothetical protein
MDNYHLNKIDDHWQLIKEGASRATKTGATKEVALQQAHDFLMDKTASLKIHSADGKIQEERTYPRKADPRQSPG